MESSTPRHQEATSPSTFTTPRLGSLPMELLVQIVHYLDQGRDALAPADQFLDYTTAQGQPGRFRHVCDKNTAYRVWYDEIDPTNPPTCFWANKAGHVLTAYGFSSHTMRKGKKADVRSLALSSRRMFEACEEVLYGRVYLYGSMREGLASLWRSFVETRPHLRKYVSHMIISDWRSLGPMLQKDLVEAPFGPILCNFAVLTNLEIRIEARTCREAPNLNKKRTSEWCRVLLEIASLKRLSTTGFKGLEDFPLLPQLEEACFRFCESPQGDSAWRKILKKLPALRTPVNERSIRGAIRGDFSAFKDTLETLEWDYYYSASNMIPAVWDLSRLKHLKIGSVGMLRASEDSSSFPILRNLRKTVETLGIYMPKYRDQESGLSPLAAYQYQLFSLTRNERVPEQGKCSCETCPSARGFWKMLEDRCPTMWKSVRLIRLAGFWREWDECDSGLRLKEEMIQKFGSLGIRVLTSMEEP
ncbi:hypothetical protein CMUS01_15729 [Colletotrichum musicola]|uniref:Uncharacterized protein n=1 Tax=Colletotrichum musicola TaxID=2175873 RepID=A0A8H6IU33_9PEZI|nr:hypothetical protein CMUS01_15729 [Colletotrichum musicola]